MKTPSWGPVVFDGRPRIIAVADKIVPRSDMARWHADGADLVEIRFDLFKASFDAVMAFAREVRAAAPFGIIGTLRETEDNRSQRLEMFQTLIPLVDGVDIEVETPGFSEHVVKAARSANKSVIVSSHDFDKTPSLDMLLSLADDCMALGADITKLACMAQSDEEAERMLVFCRECKHPRIAIAMGAHGARTRVQAMKLGSLASYAYTGNEAVAPGQFSVPELAKLLRPR